MEGLTWEQVLPPLSLFHLHHSLQPGHSCNSASAWTMIGRERSSTLSRGSHAPLGGWPELD